MDYRKFVIRPFGGLGNRLWALDSFASLCKDIGLKKFTMIWEKEENLNCSFSDLFQDVEHIEVLEIHPFNKFQFNTYWQIYNSFPPNHYKYPLFHTLFGREKTIQRRMYDSDVEQAIMENFNFKKLARNRSVYIATNRRFYSQTTYSTYLKPVDRLQNKIDEIVSLFTSSTVVGVHLRRGDHMLTREGSPVEAFISLMENEIASDKSTSFFLSTDSIDEGQVLISRFGDRVLTRNRNLDRNSTRGIQDALIDIYCLSRCSKLIGSLSSSFSDVAAKIGNIPLLIPIRKSYNWEILQQEPWLFKILSFDFRVVEI